MLIPFPKRRDILRARLIAGGVPFEGTDPATVRLRNDRVLDRWLKDGFLGFGESYMDGDWECDSIDQLCFRLLKAGLWRQHSRVRAIGNRLGSAIFNAQSKARAREVCERHYDLGNDLFQAMLDARMVYTCGYWKDASGLEQAQEAKLDLVCRKLGLRPGMRVLDIGCGFGSFMKFASERYGVECVGYSLSREQIRLGRDMCAGLPIEFIESDYREITQTFDRVVSIGMFEAVGAKNFRTYMKVVARAMKPDGIALIHTMGDNVTNPAPEPWFDRYIFPNGLVPSVTQIGRSIEGVLALGDWHCFGEDYDPTLMAWNANFQKSWPGLKAKYPERFKRMWEFYLLALAGCFRARHVELWQIIFTHPGRPIADWRKF